MKRRAGERVVPISVGRLGAVKNSRCVEAGRSWDRAAALLGAPATTVQLLCATHSDGRSDMLAPPLRLFAR